MRVHSDEQRGTLKVLTEGAEPTTATVGDWWWTANAAAIASAVQSIQDGTTGVPAALESRDTLKTVLAAYAGMLSPFEPDAAGHLIAASIMSAPAALVMAKLLVPETGEPVTAGALTEDVERADVNVIDAAARGAGEGLRLALVVGAMLIAFIALISMLNGGIGWAGGLAGIPDLTLERILGVVLAPVAWMLGVSWTDAGLIGQMIGVDFVLNEFVAYVQLSAALGSGTTVDSRSLVIGIYALTTFANFGSVAMTIAGIGAIAPSRRQDLARLGLKAMLAGLMASLATAAVAGILV